MTATAKLVEDSEIMFLIQNISPEQYSGLKEEIQRYGSIEPVTVCQNHIIENPERYHICQELNYPCSTKQIYFNTLTELYIYVCTAQLKRTDLTDEMRKYLIGREYLERLELEISYSIHKSAVRKNNILTRIANEYDMSVAAVRQNALLAEAIDSIRKHRVSLAQSILAMDFRISFQNVIELSHLTAEQLCNLELRITETHAKKITNDEIRHAICDKNNSRKRKRKKDTECIPEIRNIPVYCEDTAVKSLSLTIPSWVSSVERATQTTNFNLVSPPALDSLEENLLHLKDTIEIVEEFIREARQ